MISVIIPTYNAESYLPQLFKQLREQTLSHELIVIDSESTDKTRELSSFEELTFINIKKSEFNHGSTRNLGVRLANHETVLFLTQDALPTSPYTLERLVAMLHSREDIAMAYGRQLPYSKTGVFGHFARLINYPANSLIKTKALIPQMGIKTCSCSNSFAAYRKADLALVGGFPSDTILGEDVSVAARFILRGKAVAYCAEAEVYHSHDYTVWEEFKRYFDIGVFHNEQKDVLKEFSQAESEGFKYVMDEWSYLRQHGYTVLIPAQVVRTVVKYIGYKLGKLENFLPTLLKRQLSMHNSFWR
ncbi:glycosyltransferase family 2 protein [Spirosoma sp.]|uniref:glycosyltransferase family 2 protein n=1 Tax=Spirosoma sp. TaxID=1899569 RepID=UPI002627F4AE|nr:glycosyltransferase family 2 protein [Spirosoma sp.]MCX6214055.1 glycosyltransferase family 2 protein [Spirosoma sp.]